MKTLTVFAAAICLMSAVVVGQSPKAMFLEAAAEGDAPKVVQAMAEIDPDTKDEDGTPAIVLAARSGDFETVKVLLWRGADPEAVDADGKKAHDYLQPGTAAYAPLNLLLRCYSFSREFGERKERARVPHLVVVSDNYVDHSHPEIAPHYVINKAELNGAEGKDDDGNGFVDDVYGWNFGEDRPARFPQLAIDDSDDGRRYLTHLMNRFIAVANGKAREDQVEEILEELKNSYRNPLVRQIGFQNLAAAELDLNDFAYANMLYESSHGTHVAGIVLDASERKAQIHGCAFGVFDHTAGGDAFDYEGLISLARGADDYTDYITQILTSFRRHSVQKGSRASQYLDQLGAGVVNMSWEKGRGSFQQMAEMCTSIYQKHGKSPATVGELNTEGEFDLAEDLGLEFKIANAAAFALLFYENPDVLFCISAGNQAENNDMTLPSPIYLARFFPNVIAVASHGETGDVSEFSCYGLRSVHLAANGEDVDSCLLAGLRGIMSGTSMASPRVAGVAAGMRKDFPDYSASEIARILLATVDKKDAFKDIVLSGGVMNVAAAREMAAGWDRDNFAALAAETERARRENAPDGPVIGGSKGDDDAVATGERYMITSLAGFNGDWSIILSKKTPFTQQTVTGGAEFPLGWVKDNWDANFIITGVSGDENGWAVVMSKGIDRGQQLLGYDFDQAKIDELTQRGYRITAAGGWNEQWVIAMDEDTGYGKQRYCVPSPINQERLDWIDAGFSDGYRITAVAGDDAAKVDEDGWFFVMSTESGLGEQKVSDVGAWPTAWIAQQVKDGFHITSVAGVTDRYVVVMSKDSGLGDQLASPESELTLDRFLEENW